MKNKMKKVFRPLTTLWTALRLMGFANCLLGVVAVVWLVALSYGGLFWWVAFVAAAVGYLLILGMYVHAARLVEQNAKLSFVASWIDSGADANEISRRRAMFAEQGIEHALGAAGWTAMGVTTAAVNIDGTPMVSGTNLDIHGNVYGVAPGTAGAWNPDTGDFVAPSTAYSSPIGMDSTNS